MLEAGGDEPYAQKLTHRAHFFARDSQLMTGEDAPVLTDSPYMTTSGTTSASRVINDEQRLLADPIEFRMRVLAARDVQGSHDRMRLWRSWARVVWSRYLSYPPGRKRHAVYVHRACCGVFRCQPGLYLVYAREEQDLRCSGPLTADRVKEAIHSESFRFTGGADPLDDFLAAHWHHIVAGDQDLDRCYPETYTDSISVPPPRRTCELVREALERYRQTHGLSSTRQLAQRLGFTSDSTIRTYLATGDDGSRKWDQLDLLAERLGLEWSLQPRPLPQRSVNCAISTQHV